MMKSKLSYAIAIGFLAGILIFGLVFGVCLRKTSGIPDSNVDSVVFIYKMLRTPNKNKDLEDVLKERKLN